MTVKYVIGHWSAGNYKPCELDKKSYQTLIDGNGKVIECNPAGKTSSTGGMNSITYNVSCCGGLKTTPIKKQQAENFYKYCAQKLKEYGLKPENFYTHYEIGLMCKNGTITKLLPKNQWLYQNIGKVDLTILPNKNGKPSSVTPDFVRGKVQWYFERL